MLGDSGGNSVAIMALTTMKARFKALLDKIYPAFCGIFIENAFLRNDEPS